MPSSGSSKEMATSWPKPLSMFAVARSMVRPLRTTYKAASINSP